MPNSSISNGITADICHEVNTAQSIDQLRRLGERIFGIVESAISSSAETRNIVRYISRINDSFTLRLIELLDKLEGIRLPEGATYLVLGSEGRGEQTLRTDQDSAIVHIDNIPPGDLEKIEHFATRLVDALEEIGVPRCPGNIMANSPQWCHSFTEWKKLLDLWIAVPNPENMLNFGMLQDLRVLHGDNALGAHLCNYIRSAVHRSNIFFPNMAAHVVRFPTPFTIFGRIRTDKKGDHKGMVDIKKAGIFAISSGASLLALESGHIGGTTWEKLEFLEKQKVFTSEDHKTIVGAFEHLTKLRLQLQLRELSLNSAPTNYINPRTMNDIEHCRFRQALKGVNTFLWIFRNHYLLDMISI